MNFASKTKLDIIVLLRDGPLNVKTIAKKLDEEQSAVSHSLKKLSECHILDARKSGKERIYSLNKDTVMPMLKIVEDHVRRNCPKICNKKC
ncbi:metalloregulator ArsR/SmtB family transcription factor [Candidatus Woesearchaeota archaeon]|nr:metalloregulator ArsR/SmtB family transcription factor [Candidatus Woesearchaeota archaeon]